MSTILNASQLRRQAGWLALPALALAALGSSAPIAAGVPTTVYVNVAGTCDYPTIQAAIADLAPGSEIRLVGTEFELGAPLSLFNRNLRIAGGYPACGAPAPTGKTTLSPDFAGEAALTIGGNVAGALNVELRDLRITGAVNTTGNGGGLAITGIGLVNLVAVDVDGNLAQNGGGLYAQALLGGPLAVNLLGGTRIGNEDVAGNTATIGGGVYCAGTRMRLGQVDIMANSASDRGGGVFASECELLSTEAIGDLRIEANQAHTGGGIHAANQSLVTLSSRPQQRISIGRNLAILPGATPPRGGGVSLASIGTRFEATGVRIDDNIARGFAAGLNVGAAEALLQRGLDNCAPADLACSSLSGNQVLDDAGALTGSAAAAFVAGGGTPRLTILQTVISGNAAGSGILATGDGSILEMSGVLISGNQSQSHLIRNLSTAMLQADFLTIADNLFVGAVLQNTSTAPLALSLQRSIVLAEAGNTHLSGAGTTAFSCLNTGPGGALGGSTHAPGFFDSASGQYRLRSDSANLDQCAMDGTETPIDLAGRPRIVDRPGVPNGAGAVDRGAFEDPEDLFADGLED